MKLKEPLLFRQQAYIDGAWCNADSGATFGVDNPATGEIIGQVPDMGAAETQRAIDAANAALPAWSPYTPTSGEVPEISTRTRVKRPTDPDTNAIPSPSGANALHARRARFATKGGVAATGADASPVRIASP